MACVWTMCMQHVNVHAARMQAAQKWTLLNRVRLGSEKNNYQMRPAMTSWWFNLHSGYQMNSDAGGAGPSTGRGSSVVLRIAGYQFITVRYFVVEHASATIWRRCHLTGCCPQSSVCTPSPLADPIRRPHIQCMEVSFPRALGVIEIIGVMATGGSASSQRCATSCIPHPSKPLLLCPPQSD